MSWKWSVGGEIKVVLAYEYVVVVVVVVGEEVRGKPEQRVYVYVVAAVV